MDQQEIARSRLQVLGETFSLASTFIRSAARVEDYFSGYSTAEMLQERQKQIKARIAEITALRTTVLAAITAARTLAPSAGLAYNTEPDEPDEFTLGPDV